MCGRGQLNVYRSLLLAALAPAAVLTNTLTVPAACAGAVTLSRVVDTNVVGSKAPPLSNFTVAPGTNPVPLIVTVFPPAVDPAPELPREADGGPNAYRSPVLAALVPAAVLTNTLPVPAACAGAVTLSCVPDTNVVGSKAPPLPNLTIAPGTNPVPMIVTVFPPAVDP